MTEPNADFSQRPADAFVRARISDAAAGPAPTVSFSGLLGDSDREGRRRLYFNASLDYYAEFATADIVAFDDIPSDQPPFVGLDATRVTLTRDARIEFTYAATAGTGSGDAFDLDIRSKGSVAPNAAAVPTLDEGATCPLPPPPTRAAECPGPSFFRDCGTIFNCSHECPTGWGTVCKPFTCNPRVCVTRDEEATCVTCRATCDTCRTNCGTCQTCDTCQTNCGTCQTCDTCQTNCGTCTCPPPTRQTCRTCFDEGRCGITFAQTHCPTCRC